MMRKKVVTDVVYFLSILIFVSLIHLISECFSERVFEYFALIRNLIFALLGFLLAIRCPVPKELLLFYVFFWSFDVLMSVTNCMQSDWNQDYIDIVGGGTYTVLSMIFPISYFFYIGVWVEYFTLNTDLFVMMSLFLTTHIVTSLLVTRLYTRTKDYTLKKASKKNLNMTILVLTLVFIGFAAYAKIFPSNKAIANEYLKDYYSRGNQQKVYVYSLFPKTENSYSYIVHMEGVSPETDEKTLKQIHGEIQIDGANKIIDCVQSE